MGKQPDMPDTVTSDLMSNFDHEIENHVAEELRARPNEICAVHAARDFCGYVWYNGSQFLEDVYIYGAFQKRFAANTPEKLMEKVNNEFGWE